LGPVQHYLYYSKNVENLGFFFFSKYYKIKCDGIFGNISFVEMKFSKLIK
jgi:hypothetical protein